MARKFLDVYGMGNRIAYSPLIRGIPLHLRDRSAWPDQYAYIVFHRNMQSYFSLHPPNRLLPLLQKRIARLQARIFCVECGKPVEIRAQ